MKKLLLILACVYTGTSVSSEWAAYYKKNPPNSISHVHDVYRVDGEIVSAAKYNIATAVFNLLKTHRLLMAEQAKATPNEIVIAKMNKELTEHAGLIAKYDAHGACTIS